MSAGPGLPASQGERERDFAKTSMMASEDFPPLPTQKMPLIFSSTSFSFCHLFESYATDGKQTNSISLFLSIMHPISLPLPLVSGFLFRLRYKSSFFLLLLLFFLLLRQTDVLIEEEWKEEEKSLLGQRAR